MSWRQSWNDLIKWYRDYADDPVYSWAGFFPDFLQQLGNREAAMGLYAHRWATTAVISRYGVQPDWMEGPKLELLPLPKNRLEVVVFDFYNRKVHKVILDMPLDLAEFDHWLQFVAGETPAL